MGLVLLALVLCLTPATGWGELPDVFIQQEHEGRLNAPPEPGTLGNVFSYYWAVTLSDRALQETWKELALLDRTTYGFRHKVLRYDPWESLTTYGKVRYLVHLEKEIAARYGEKACWNQDTCRLLIKKPGAPPYLDTHPKMEYQKDNPFLMPEVVTAKESPAFSVAEAIDRARRVVKEIGHSGTHFHVFVKVSPDTLRSQLPRLLSAVQLLNDDIFLEAAYGNTENLFRDNVIPWHQGKSRTVSQILSEGSVQPHEPDWADPINNEKTASLAVRYWGMEEGKRVLSLELRGVAIGWKTPLTLTPTVRGLEEGQAHEKSERDFEPIQRYLTSVYRLAHALKDGNVPESHFPQRILDEPRAERLIRERAIALGWNEGQYFTLREFSLALAGGDRIVPSLLVPFSDPARGLEDPRLRQFVDRFLHLSREAKRLNALDRCASTYREELGAVFRGWIRPELLRVKSLRVELEKGLPMGQKSCPGELGSLGRASFPFRF